MRALVLGLAVFLVGCAAPPETCSSFRPEGLSADESARVASAVARWSAFSGQALTFGPDGECPVSVGSLRDRKGDVGAFWVGAFYEDDRSVVLDADRMRSEVAGCSADVGRCVEAVALHEVGHALGLEHVADRGVMSTGRELVEDFTEADRAECRRVRACR